MPAAATVDAPATRVVHVRAVVAAVGTLVVCWLLLMPPGSGPDEPGHLVRAGAVIRGDLGDQNTYPLPDRYQVAEPGCYAFQPTVPASCAVVPVHTGATLDLSTNAGGYPVWGHGVFGASTLLPGLDPVWWARLVGALIATVLVGWSLARAAMDHRLTAAGLLLGLTPMAWSTFGTVNPSSMVIAGAVAVWVGLLVAGDDPPISHRAAGWLTAAGWAALVLPRRDGLVWACITLVIALAATHATTTSWWRTLSRTQQGVIIASTVVTMVWGALSDSRSTQMVVLAPLLVAATEAWRWWWHRPAQSRAIRVVGGALVVVAATVVTFLLIGTRPGGWDTDLAIDIVMQTDENLVEAIGVLGWLDTVVPVGVVYLWLLAIGILVGAALLVDARDGLIWAGALIAAIAVSSWVLELVQGNPSGLYWQGRYSIPLLVGVPLLLARSLPNTRNRLDVVGRVVGVLALVGVNAAAWAAARRFGVGISGSLLPWRWDTPIQPVPPVLVLVVHAAVSFWIVTLLWPMTRPGVRNHG